ncbi:polysaccharide biosynthesis/export family protein [Chryseosolibacter indicus]|uniref:Polysaccharide biosynthesis/export family protein n=1 Tax=Chryseosolibacter indicus TaxID=2782351 RepID=A0ABS5VVP9_9BACT|nr:polysaccharide biosynthesis/export family protein [Chryseosolibacter indicus]MBT1704887.1 polysaccharide biosynthesis/export family protein [Chryseosolibacter indicus]
MRLYLLFVGLIFFASCVSNKKVTLLQKNDVNATNLPKDSVIRTYAIDTFQYKVQPNDILSVRFESLSPKELDIFSTSQNQLNVQLQGTNGLVMGELVDEKGEISIPFVGKFKVSGLTVFEVQDTLEHLANQYVEAPTVKVRLINYRITILGEVKNEGSITLSNNRVSMLEAIGISGGFNDLADRANVKLIRQRGGQTEVQYINLLDENFIRSPYYYVYQGDVLIVPPLKQRPFRNYFGQNLALFVSSLSVLLLAFNLLQN